MKFQPLVVLGVAVILSAGCTDNATAVADARRLRVTASDTECLVSAVSAPSGTLTFAVTNTGSLANEFYLLAGDGQRVIAEVENIGPGLTRELVLNAPAGSYFSVCKPGMVGQGIRTGFLVTDSG